MILSYLRRWCLQKGVPAFNLRLLSQETVLSNIEKLPSYIELSEPLKDEPQLARALVQTITVHNEFLTEAEEHAMFEEVEPYMHQLKYEFDHWDDAIHGYRETERLKWDKENTETLNRVRQFAFPVGVAQLKYVHVLDLDKNGYIKPHVDAVRFCGDTIAGLSLLSDSIMRLVLEKDSGKYANILLARRSLYIMKGTARYDYTHEILSNAKSQFKGVTIAKDRRISVICRNEPSSSDRS